MINNFKTSVNVTRIELCDLLAACLVAKMTANDSGEKWDKLHDKLKSQLDELDRQLESVLSSI